MEYTYEKHTIVATFEEPGRRKVTHIDVKASGGKIVSECHIRGCEQAFTNDTHQIHEIVMREHLKWHEETNNW